MRWSWLVMISTHINNFVQRVLTAGHIFPRPRSQARRPPRNLLVKAHWKGLFVTVAIQPWFLMPVGALLRAESSGTMDVIMDLPASEPTNLNLFPQVVSEVDQHIG
jgi:hypothetical protein